MLGWAAVTGLSTAADWINASLLVAIIFVWTPPHFWALAIFRRADYAKASIPMLPVTHGVQHTSRQILLYTVILECGNAAAGGDWDERGILSGGCFGVGRCVSLVCLASA